MATITGFIRDLTYWLDELDQPAKFNEGCVTLEDDYCTIDVDYTNDRAKIDRVYRKGATTTKSVSVSDTFNKELFEQIFLSLLNERRRVCEIEQRDRECSERQRDMAEMEIINHAGSMANH